MWIRRRGNWGCIVNGARKSVVHAGEPLRSSGEIPGAER